MLNLDTHILIFALTDQLKPREEKLLIEHEWSISAIVLWELTKLAEIGRIHLDVRDAETTRVLNRIHVWPLTLAVCQAIPDLDFDSDPADEIIAATSIVHDVKLLTRDSVLKKSKLVPLAR